MGPVAEDMIRQIFRHELRRQLDEGLLQRI